MLIEIVLLILGLALLYIGGEQLVKSSVYLGARLGLSTLVVGLTLVAFGTSAPELAVSLDAALTDHPDIAVANIVGSNLANIGLVAAVAAIAGKVVLNRDLVRKDLPIMLMVLGLLVWFITDTALSRNEGMVLLGTLAGYIIYRIAAEKRQTSGGTRETPSGRAITAAGGAILGLALLTAGGDLLVSNAASLAIRMGVSEAFIGFSIVAIGTSLPEIAASVAAVRLGHGAIAIGNVIGSNIWNSLGVLGVTAVAVPFDNINIPWHLLAAMFGFSCLLLVVAIAAGRMGRRWGFTFLGTYLAYLVYSG